MPCLALLIFVKFVPVSDLMGKVGHKLAIRSQAGEYCSEAVEKGAIGSHRKP